MCGRYQIHANPDQLIEHFGAEAPKPFHFHPRYNAAPTDLLPVVRARGDTHLRELMVARWGLIPTGSRDPSVGSRLINARSETAADRPSFRKAFRHRRCLVPAHGFYEWRRIGNRKQPYHVGPADGSLFAFAGLWEEWVSPDGVLVDTFTILTTEPNDLVRPLHDRMPVVVAPSDYEAWLDPQSTDPEQIHPLLKPASITGWRTYPVTPAMNRVDFDAPECLTEVDEDELTREEEGRVKARAQENLDLFTD